MKRLQIMIEEDLDDALKRQALSDAVCKAALIRRFIRERIEPLPPLESDPLWDLVGIAEGADPAHHDDAVYPVLSSTNGGLCIAPTRRRGRSVSGARPAG